MSVGHEISNLCMWRTRYAICVCGTQVFVGHEVCNLSVGHEICNLCLWGMKYAICVWGVGTILSVLVVHEICNLCLRGRKYIIYVCGAWDIQSMSMGHEIFSTPMTSRISFNADLQLRKTANLWSRSINSNCRTTKFMRLRCKLIYWLCKDNKYWVKRPKDSHHFTQKSEYIDCLLISILALVEVNWWCNPKKKKKKKQK